MNLKKIGGSLLLLGLMGCHHPYDPAENPLLTASVTDVVPRLVMLENEVKKNDFSREDWIQDGTGVSLVYACWVNPSHFETPESRGAKNCERIFEKVVKEAHQQSGILKSLTREDLNDPNVQLRLGRALFSFSVHGHLPH